MIFILEEPGCSNVGTIVVEIFSLESWYCYPQCDATATVHSSKKKKNKINTFHKLLAIMKITN